jgi:Uncharacterized protein conserved in bacteria
MVIKNGVQVLFDEGYVNDLRGRRIGIVTNHSAQYPGKGHLVDLLVKSGVDVRVIFTPEHGLMGDRPAGEHYPNGAYGGIPVYSLYGPRYKPPVDVIKGLDAVIYSIQMLVLGSTPTYQHCSIRLNPQVRRALSYGA